MRVFTRLAVAATAAGLILGTAAGTASAATATARPDSHTSWAVRLLSGETSLTTAPGIAGVLLHNDIVPIATLPGVAGAQSGLGGVSVRFSFRCDISDRFGGWSPVAALVQVAGHSVEQAYGAV